MGKLFRVRSYALLLIFSVQEILFEFLVIIRYLDFVLPRENPLLCSKMNIKELPISDYCASFIDLLGQKHTLAGEGRKPNIDSDSFELFIQKVYDSVGVIKELHQKAESLVSKTRVDCSETCNLSTKDKAIYQELGKGTHKK